MLAMDCAATLEVGPGFGGVCPPHVPVSMEDVLVMNGIPYEAQMPRPQDEAIQGMVWVAVQAAEDVYQGELNLTVNWQTSPYEAPLQIPEIVRRGRAQVFVGRQYLQAMEQMILRFPVPAVGMSLLLQPSNGGPKYEYELELQRRGTKYMMSSKAMPLRLAPPGSLVLVGFATIPVFLWHLGISAKTWRDIGRTVRRVCRCKKDEAGGKRVTRRTAAELIAPGMDAARHVWIAFRSCLPCCKKRGDEPAPTVEAEAPKAEEPKEAWQAPKSRYTITGMKQLFGPSRKKGEIAAGKIGVGMEAEAPKLA